MNLVKKDEVFQLKDLIAIEGGKILTEQLVDNDAIKMVLKSFDAGMQLPEHTAQEAAYQHQNFSERYHDHRSRIHRRPDDS